MKSFAHRRCHKGYIVVWSLVFFTCSVRARRWRAQCDVLFIPQLVNMLPHICVCSSCSCSCSWILLLLLLLLLVAVDGLLVVVVAVVVGVVLVLVLVVVVVVVVVAVVVVTPAALFSVSYSGRKSSIMWCFRFFVETFGAKNTVHTDVFCPFPHAPPCAGRGFLRIRICSQQPLWGLPICCNDSIHDLPMIKPNFPYNVRPPLDS